MLEHRIANFPNYVICDSSVSYLTHNLARVRVADLVGCLRVRTNARASSLVITCGHPWRLWRHRGPQLISMTHRSLVTVYDVLAPNYVIRCVSCRLFSPRLVSIRYLVSLRHQHLLMTSSSLRKLMSSFIFTTHRQHLLMTSPPIRYSRRQVYFSPRLLIHVSVIVSIRCCASLRHTYFYWATSSCLASFA